MQRRDDEMVTFVWPVTEAGYAWEGAEAERILVAVRAWPTQRHEPTVQQTALFRTFARLSPDPDSALKFATRYGHLGEFLWVGGAKFDPTRAQETEGLNARLLSQTGREHAVLGRERPETLSFWRAQIEAMRSADVLWDEIQAGKADPDRTRQVAEAIERGCRGRVEDRFEYDSRDRTTGWHKLPLDLLGAMWLQFSDVVAGNKRVRQCPVCSDWFVVAPGRARADKQVCSVNCRQKAYQNRRERAVALYAANKSFEKTAAELDSDVETVKGWIEKAKPVKKPKPDNGGGSEEAEDKGLRRGLDL